MIHGWSSLVFGCWWCWHSCQWWWRWRWCMAVIITYYLLRFWLLWWLWCPIHSPFEEIEFLWDHVVTRSIDHQRLCLYRHLLACDGRLQEKTLQSHPRATRRPVLGPQKGSHSEPEFCIKVFSHWLVVWTPLKNMKVSWDDYFQCMEKETMFQTT